VDHVLDAGDSWAVERNGRTIVQAQTATIVDVTGPGAAAAAVIPLASPPAPQQLADWLARAVNDWLERRWVPYV
jgi:hypothetical protein